MALDFPNNPSVGQEFTGGGFTWVWSGTTWSKLAAATGGVSGDFVLTVGNSGNTTYVLDRVYPAGRYLIDFINNDTTYDIYFIAEDGTNAGYTNTDVALVSADFEEVVVIGAAANETITFTHQGTSTSPSSAGDVATAGAFINSVVTSNLPNVNDTTVINGGNFAANVAVSFIGQNSVETAAKNVVRSSSTQLVATRPDSFTTAQSPYTVKVLNPGVPAPTGSSRHLLTNAVTAGTNPSWVTGTTVFYNITGPTSITLLATDTEASDIDYTIVTGTLPAGLQLDNETGVISGTFSGSASEGAVTNVTFRATDAGGNFVDRAIALTANASPTWTTTAGALAQATSGTPYSFQLVASSGTAGGTLTYTVQSGSLPSGMTLNSSGLISGTSAVLGNNSFTVRVTDQSGAFTDRAFSIEVSSQFPIQYVVVAGGGAGGTILAGGGAGGYRTSNSFLVNPQTNYTVTVGAGGATSTTYPTRGGSGTNSVFGSISATGGGGGAGEGPQQFGAHPGMNGSAGGSGGGGGQYSGVGGTGNAGGYSPVEGYDGGGVAGYLQAYAGGAGGGAGGAGTPGTGAGGGNGGVGAISTIISTALATSLSVGQVSGGNVYFAGGGPGVNGNQGTDGTPGLGGGGTAQQAGAARTGGGGSGKRSDLFPNANVSGGSGVVILRYPATSNLNVGAGLTSSTTTVNTEKVTVFTAGTGTVSFS